MAYDVDLRKKAILMVENGMSKVETAKLLEIGEATLYRWLKKKATGESLEPKKNVRFVRKIDPQKLAEYVKKHSDYTLAEMGQDLGFGISSIWYRLKQLGITLKKSHEISRE